MSLYCPSVWYSALLTDSSKLVILLHVEYEQKFKYLVIVLFILYTHIYTVFALSWSVCCFYAVFLYHRDIFYASYLLSSHLACEYVCADDFKGPSFSFLHFCYILGILTYSSNWCFQTILFSRGNVISTESCITFMLGQLCFATYSLYM